MSRVRIFPGDSRAFDVAPEGDYLLKITNEPERLRLPTRTGGKVNIIRFELLAYGGGKEYTISASMFENSSGSLWEVLGYRPVETEAENPRTGNIEKCYEYDPDLTETVGRTFNATIKHRENKKNPGNPYLNIINPQPVGVIDEDDEVDLSGVADMEDDDVPPPNDTDDNQVPF